MLIRYFVGLLICTALAGCATPSARDYTPVPRDRILVNANVTDARESGVIEIRRHPGLLGAALSVRLAVDGVDTLVIDSGESASLNLPVGERRIAVRWANDLESFSSIRITVSKTAVVRVGINVIPSPAVFGKAQPSVTEQ